MKWTRILLAWILGLIIGAIGTYYLLFYVSLPEWCVRLDKPMTPVDISKICHYMEEFERVYEGQYNMFAEVIDGNFVSVIVFPKGQNEGEEFLQKVKK